MPSISASHVLFGRPLPSERLEHERLNKKTALAVLSSDAISSVAYATDQILFVLGGAIGMAARRTTSLPISAVIVGLLVLVGLSYRQTVFAYPNGGGSYTVARENLGVDARPHRRRGAAHRLHPHRCRLDLRRRRGDHVGVSGARAAHGAALRRCRSCCSRS